MSDRRRLLVTALFGAALFGAGACVQAPDDIGATRGAALDVCATAPEGALCDDKNVCTIFDVCKAGICKGSAAPNGTLCTDGNVCTANDSCRSGSCAGDAVPDLTACTDGDPCTVGDACKTGACVPGAAALACNDGVACTLDVCVSGLGCVFAPAGDCTVPKDAGPDVKDAADAKSDADAPVPDAMMMSGVDGPSDKADGTVGIDTAAPIDAPKETSAPDVAAPADGPKETGGVEVGVEVGAEVGPTEAGGGDAKDGPAPEVDAGVDADAGEDAGEDAAEDAGDAAADAEPDAAPTVPVLRASGGACSCETAAGPSGSGAAMFGLGVLLAFARGRRRGRRR